MPTAGEHARPAEARDRSAIDRLVGLARGALRSQRDGDRLLDELSAGPNWLASFDAVLRDPNVALVVGSFDDVVVGFGLVTCCTESGVRSDQARIVALYVEPDGRSVGIGEAILDEILTWCDREQLVGIDALALPGDRSTKAFYEEMGFRARLIVMQRDVSTIRES